MEVYRVPYLLTVDVRAVAVHTSSVNACIIASLIVVFVLETERGRTTS